MTGIASLGMYDHGVQQAANDWLWAAIAKRLKADGIVGVPERLDRSRSVHEIWHDPDLLFGQICGYPLISDPALTLRVVAVPVYVTLGSAAGLHRSFVIARGDDAETLADYRGRRAVINDARSNTGMNLFRALIAGVADRRPFFGSVHESGAHRASIRAIIAGEADIAAIDAVSYAAVLRDEPGVTGLLRFVAETVDSATLPFVTARATPPETVAALRAALREAIADPELAEARAALFLNDILPGDVEHYSPLRTLEIEAVIAGYPDLR